MLLKIWSVSWLLDRPLKKWRHMCLIGIQIWSKQKIICLETATTYDISYLGMVMETCTWYKRHINEIIDTFT